MLAYDNLMHYVLYTNPLGGGTSGGADSRSNERIARSSIDRVAEKYPVRRVEQRLDDVSPAVRKLLDGI